MKLLRVRKGNVILGEMDYFIQLRPISWAYGGHRGINSTARATTTMVLTKPNPFELVSVDFVGPRSLWGQEWHYVVLIDHCSRFVVTKAVQSANGDSAIQALRELWSPVFGAPRAVLSDNGDLAAHLIYSSPYYPQANYH
eukprot:GHVN01041665.1.p1 GENE.GHVN01041665.1~~GHVN01041665.1.p1  ORF type:complete len:140 (-),score=6.30 GHVN01041665.1:197-616(-)